MKSENPEKCYSIDICKNDPFYGTKPMDCIPMNRASRTCITTKAGTQEVSYYSFYSKSNK